MIERIRAVNNPLTIIAIFAALAEIAGTVALRLVGHDLQPTFIWFVMLFPALLVLLFFLTLNFNPRVLYAPSDFKNEDNFLNLITDFDRVSGNLDHVQAQLETAKSQIIEDAVKQIGIAGEKERTRLEEIVSNRIKPVLETVETTRGSAEDVANIWFSVDSPSVRNRILQIIASENRPMSLREIVMRSGGQLDNSDVTRRLRELVHLGILERTTDNKYKNTTYQLLRPESK